MRVPIEIENDMRIAVITKGHAFEPVPFCAVFDDPPPGRIMHITVERVGGVGPWARER